MIFSGETVHGRRHDENSLLALAVANTVSQCYTVHGKHVLTLLRSKVVLTTIPTTMMTGAVRTL